MSKLLVALAATTMLYEAQVQTYGCNSDDQLGKLKELRSNEHAFQLFLYQQVVGGECVVFTKGAEVQGTPVETDASLLHVQGQIDPPGYIAPASDFKPKEGTDEKR
jgi:hypothetical protein